MTSRATKFLLPAIAVAGGAYYFNSLQTNEPVKPIRKIDPVFTGSGEWVDLKLADVKKVSHDTALYTFNFPTAEQQSGLVTASAILTKYVTPKGSNVVRPYTPINDIEDEGKLELLVKTYPNGKMSKHIQELKVNDTLSFKGPIVKWQYKPKQFKEISLIGGGTGITPLYQLIREILKNDNDDTKITLLYGSRTADDILLKKELDALAAKKPQQFQIKYFIDEGESKDNVSAGFITKEVLQANLPKPSEDTHVFVCGPPPLYKAISGMKKSPSDQGEVEGALKELGYTKNEVFKF